MLKSKRHRIHSGTTFLLAVALASACGGFGGEKKKKGGGSNPQGIDTTQTTEVRLGLRQDSSLLSLAAPASDDFVIQITGCSSTYTTTVTSTTADPEPLVALYTGDGNCVAGLESFDWDGVSYVRAGGGTLTSGGSFFNDGGANELYVQVDTSLPGTIGPGAEAIFAISEVKAGSDYAISGYSTSAGLTVSAIEAPELQIPAGGITLTGIDPVSGIATFDVHAQCANTLSPDATTCQTPGEDNQLFTGMRAKLVTDIYAGVIDYSDAEAIMAAGTTDVTGPDLSVAAPITTEGFVLSLSGAGALFTNKNMLLVIEYTSVAPAGKSYRFFNVDIGDPQL
jgi:hypothetical protein